MENIKNARNSSLKWLSPDNLSPQHAHLNGPSQGCAAIDGPPRLIRTGQKMRGCGGETTLPDDSTQELSEAIFWVLDGKFEYFVDMIGSAPPDPHHPHHLLAENGEIGSCEPCVWK